MQLSAGPAILERRGSGLSLAPELRADTGGLSLAPEPRADTGSPSLLSVDDVAELYRAHAARIRGLVRLQVRAPTAVIEDACQFAWCRLLVHRARIRRETATAWLVRVAVREAMRTMRRGSREQSLDALIERLGPSPVSRTPAGGALSGSGRLEDVVDQRIRLESIRVLPERQRRLVWLQGLGLSYREMAGETGMTTRTVERQLLRAKRSLAQA